jgi:hypothetical protein
MPLSVISQPPNDSFSFRLFYSLVKDYAEDADIIYIWSLMLDPNWECVKWNNIFEKFLPTGEIHYRKLLKQLINKDILILCIKDHLTCGDCYNKIPQTVEYLNDMIDYYSDKKIILFTSVENLEFYLNHKNLYIIPIGGDLTNQKRQYQNLNPVTEKNLDSSYIFLNLNRQHRLHRTIILSSIYGLGLDEKGFISCMFQSNLDKNKKEIDELSLDYLSNGFDKLKCASFAINDSINIYKSGNDNVSNFKNKLSEYYQKTFVEIISETSFFENCFLLTEKTLNCFYGSNFPILMCSKGSVQFLRELGLDMFDDIVDHSYDQEVDPIKRIKLALELNKKLLTDELYVKDHWINCQHRFEKNVSFLKNDMYKFFENRAKEKFLDIKGKIWI